MFNQTTMFNIRSSHVKDGARHIAFAGICAHIGTSTQALQLLLYLQNTGRSACYVEFNNSGFLSALQSLYADLHRRERDGRLYYRNIAFYRAEDYYRLGSLPYDYVIRDYGVYAGEGFARYSFLEQDCQCLVCGSKANEIFALEKVLRDKGKDFFYIFSFVPYDERDVLRNLLGEAGKRVFFAPLWTDMFSYDESNMNYKLMLGL